MKKLLTIVFALLPLCLMAEDYDSMVKEGKEWRYVTYDIPSLGIYYYSLKLSGDTIIAGKKCHKMYSQNRNNLNERKYEGALYEEGRKVYAFLPMREDAGLIYDFGCGSEEHLMIGYPNTIYYEEFIFRGMTTVEYGDVSYKRYELQSTKNPDTLMKWIEGVGGEVGDFFCPIPIPGNYGTLVMCTIDNKVIYKSEQSEFWDEATPVTFPTMQHETQKQECLFDLQGRRISGQPKSGIYIRNGRKVSVVHQNDK